MSSHRVSAKTPVWPHDPLPEIGDIAADRPLIVLDDDPTGTQTVRDVTVLTRWPQERLVTLFESRNRATFLLTNSRSLPSANAVDLAHDLGAALQRAAAATGVAASIVSRSDSTLRGHFPAEVDALADALGKPDARVLLAPFFGDGGRVTIGGTHYVADGDALTPVGETEFARDAVFGFEASALADWVHEKSDDASRTVASIGLRDIRTGGPEVVSRALSELPARGVLAVDAVCERDIEVVALGTLRAEMAGVPLIARTAASYVRARAAQDPAAPLRSGEYDAGTPGLVVVGSHVPTTTRQLAVLLDDPPTPVEHMELDVGDVVGDPSTSEAITSELAARADAAIEHGITPVIATSRELRRGAGARADLTIGAAVSRTLSRVVHDMAARPAWILSKGGITSSDVATDGLGMSEASVIGPLLPGVPTWRCGQESRWPGMTYVVFPGNVGTSGSLRLAVAALCV